MAVGGVFGEAEIERCVRIARSTQEVLLLKTGRLREPAPALAGGIGAFDLAEKIIGRCQNLRTTPDREVPKPALPRASDRMPMGAVEEHAGPGIEAAGDQRVIVAEQIAPAERRAVQEIDLGEIEAVENPLFAWLPCPDMTAEGTDRRAERQFRLAFYMYALHMYALHVCVVSVVYALHVCAYAALYAALFENFYVSLYINIKIFYNTYL